MYFGLSLHQKALSIQELRQKRQLKSYTSNEGVYSFGISKQVQQKLKNQLIKLLN